MNRVVSRLGFTTLALVAGVAAHAQSSTTGGISGVVKDKSGAPVAGATITASSVQTTRTVQTGTDGSFRLGLLNSGEWTLKVAKSGMQANTQKLTVLINQNSPVTFTLDKEASAVVEVVGVSTTIDNTTTQQGLAISMENLAAVPKGRDMNTLAFLTPGVASSGFAGGPSISGASGAENQYVVDGLITTNFARGFQGASLVTDFIDQVEVQTGGFKPEFSALGGVFNAVTKSGSNEFKGSAWLTWDAIGIQAVPKKGTFAKQGAASSRYDVGAEVSGPIMKDKLFYFVGLDLTRTEPQPGVANLSGAVPGGKPSTDVTQFVGKLNWYLAPDHQLTFAVNTNNTVAKSHGAIPSTYGTANFGGERKIDVTNLSLNYDWTISSALFLSLKGGQAKTKDNTIPDDTTNPLIVDGHWYSAGSVAGGIVAGPGFGTAGAPPAGTPYNRGGFDLYSRETQTANQVKADLNWYLGTHSLKFGIGMLTSEYYENQKMSGGARYTINSSGRTVTVQRNSTDATVKAEYQHIYAQDAWEMFSGFKTYFGFRFETQNQKDLNGKSFMKFDDFSEYVQPRVGFTWDINNDGKSKLSASYGTYFEQIPQRMAIRVFANESFTRNRYTRTQGLAAGATSSYPGVYSTVFGNPYTYSATSAGDFGTISGAANGSSAISLGALGYTPTGTDTAASLVFLAPAFSDYAIPFSFDPIAEDTKLTQRQEYTLGFDQTFASGYTVGVHAKHRVLKNPIEDSVITDLTGTPYDLGADSGGGVYFGQAILWNPGHNTAWTSRSISGTPNTRFVVGETYYDKAGNTYDAVDLTISKTTDRSTMSFSYTWSRLQGNYEGLVSSSNGQADANITASMDYYPYVGYGLLPLDRTHMIKVFGSRRFEVGPGDLNMGFNWTYQSGTPVSLFDDGSSTTNGQGPGGTSLDIGGYGNATPQNGIYGNYGRTPATNNMDVRLDYSLKFGKKFKLVPSVDIFNFFNSRTATSVFQSATDGNGNPRPAGYYGADSGWQTGRRYRFGIKFQF